MYLSRQNCSVLRGMAIICIFIHNYCHLLPNAPEENEFSWSLDRVHYFWDCVFNEPLISLFSFLGHYGVPVFLFLSGYGLVKKYERNDLEWSFSSYVITHYKKLVRLMLPGLILYLILFWLLYNNFDGINVFKFVTQLLFINNLIPTKYSAIIPGPYWYFGLTMQLYIVYGILRKNNRNIIICMAICLFLMFSANGHHYLIVWLKYNIIGNALPFTIGIFFAKYNIVLEMGKPKYFIALLSLLSLMALMTVEFHYYSWIFASVFVISFFLCVLFFLHGQINRYLSFIGSVSHIIFVIHPIVRVLLYYIQDKYNINWQICLPIYILLTITLSFFWGHYHNIGGLRLRQKLMK